MSHRSRYPRIVGASVAATAALMLAAGMTAPSSAAAPDAAAPATAGKASAGKPGAVQHWVMLITGDRVGVDAKGQAVSVQRAKGREHIPVQLQRIAGHSHAIPLDAQQLISQGKLDKRLFDVTLLSSAEYRKSRRGGVKLIVDYKGSRSAAQHAVRSAEDTRVRRTFPALGVEAVVTRPTGDARSIWEALTEGRRGTAFRAAVPGLEKVWLDAVVKPSLDKSVPQIGAPAAWAAGYDGTGVKIAVLDTGVDQTHPDLVGQQIAEKNFSGSPTMRDGIGHGTHVAATAAGTGAKSGGKYKGVAPGAKILDGKVFDDNGGSGEDSTILAAIEWAAAEGADIVNLSLGSGDSPGIDPLEAEINRLSAEKGILFAVAAGNNGRYGAGTIESPGSADAALTVGAVDDDDKLADFSGRGPRNGDSAVKPDVTAPGVNITAAAVPGSLIDREYGQNPPGYATISGTSMATPHVAGAAALLKQQHPDWTGERLKSVLTGSAKDGGFSPDEQGSGRIDLTRAIKQTVFAEGPVSLNLGLALWPHADDTPATKKVVYRNTGTTDVTLGLSVAGTGPDGTAAPAGFFTLSADKVTVPAGGTAEASLTADTKLDSAKDGRYSAYITASGGGQSVRTAAVVEREAESYALTVKFIDRNGEPAKSNYATIFGLSGLGENRDFGGRSPADTATIRAPKGTYFLSTNLTEDPQDPAKGVDWITQPELRFTGPTTLTVDARKAKPVDITVPDRGAKMAYAAAELVSKAGNGDLAGVGWGLTSYKNFRTAALGPQVTDRPLYQRWSAQFVKGASSEYGVLLGGKVSRPATGYTRHVKTSELAKVTLTMGAPAPGLEGTAAGMGYLPGLWTPGGSEFLATQRVPGKRTLYVSTVDGAKWTFRFMQLGPVDGSGNQEIQTYRTLGDEKRLQAGRHYTRTVNVGVFSPSVTGTDGIYRLGDEILPSMDLLADGEGSSGDSVYTSANTTLYRNGTKIGEHKTPANGESAFTVPAAEADYKLTTSIKRDTAVSRVSTRVDASWTFTSKKAEEEKMPISSVKFLPALALDSTARPGATARIPVKVLGEAAKPGNLKSLTVYASYNDGRSWQKLTVTNGKITVKNPKAGKGISFKADVTDKKGNKSSVTIYNAYLGK